MRPNGRGGAERGCLHPAAAQGTGPSGRGKRETMKLLEENIGKTLSKINHSRILYDPPARILDIKAKINGT